ncbi:MAG: YggS family pyridoxal phosphate-dependent enzyme [Oscillospiraceae bacterium]|nr:YggS family pyridoxal phosphate-dependent enzyme [Oscillospiraceae bacterium]
MVNVNAIDEIKNYLKPTDTLVCVSKKQDIEAIMSAYELGIRDFGENIVSEFINKYEKLPKDIKWHFVGHLQSNKVKYIIGKTFLIHSLDRVSLLNELEGYSKKLKIETNALIQVNISKEPQKGGVFLEDIDALLEDIEKCKHIKVKGLMSIGSTELEKSKEEFIVLKLKWDEIKKNEYNNIKMEYLSMGMSDDFKIALECGSNMIRVGTYIFGSRNNV